MNTATVGAVAEKSVSSATKQARVYANDGSFESVKAMLHSMAYKFTKRVTTLGLPMEYEDVFQELCLSYVQAKKTWKPEGGAKFITYCVYAAQNNFNEAIRKMARDREQMGMSSIDGFGYQDGFDYSDSESPLNWLENAKSAPSFSPEFRMQSAETMKQSLDGLSPIGKKFVGMLLKSEIYSNEPLVKLSEITKLCGIKGRELARLRVEIYQTFGVKWQM